MGARVMLPGATHAKPGGLPRSLLRGAFLGSSLLRGLVCLVGLVLIAPGLQASPGVGTVRLGGRDGWDRAASFTNLRLVPGWEGGEDIALDEGALPVAGRVDLLADFDGTLEDQTGNYRASPKGVRLVGTPRRRGSAAAGFDGTGELVFYPRPGALFAPRQQPGSFSIDFWLYPNRVTQGATLFRWKGALLEGQDPVLQTIRLEISDRRLHWVFSHVLVRADRGGLEPLEEVRLSARRGLVPRVWQHHQLRYDATTGQLAYLVDQIPEDVIYMSESGREEPGVFSLYFGHDTGDGILLGRGFEGALDEFRISRSPGESFGRSSGHVAGAEPQLSRYSGSPGRMITAPLDLGGSGARLLSVESRVQTPGNTDVRGYYRLADLVVSRDAPEALPAEWNPLPSSGMIKGDERGRYLQLRYDFLADATREESPRLQEVRIGFDPVAPPAPPRIVRGTPVPGGVRLEWSAVQHPDLAGYRVYFGERPRSYTGSAGVVSPLQAGTEQTITVRGLEPDVPYVFALESYDRHGQAGPLSREIEVRAGREGEQ